MFRIFLSYIHRSRLAFRGLAGQIFSRKNLTKVFFIFTFGFSFRVFIGSFYGVNVFTDFLSYISLLYYMFMSCFIVLVHELVAFFDFSIFPSFANLYYPISFLVDNFYNFNRSLWVFLNNFNLKGFSLSSFRG